MEKKENSKSALSVSKGVKKPPSVNPDFRRKSRPDLSDFQFIDGILKRDKTVLGQAITMIESKLHEHNELAQKIIEACLPYTGKSIRIGITGVPGVGKSSFIESIGNFLVRNGHKLAVLTIDPSSERSKGSIMGDKTRMESLSAHPDVFIRPSPASGTLGGVARKTRETILLCEAAGYDIIFVETVGVGQSETAIHSMVDFFLLLLLPGAGDELQGIKRGIVEMADLLVVTKADGFNIESAQRAAADYQSAIHMFPTPDSGWKISVLTCSALKNSGMEQIWQNIMDYKKHVTNTGFFNIRRTEQALHWMNETIKETLSDNFYSNNRIQKELSKLRDDVLNMKISPFVAARQILSNYYGKE